MSHREDYEEYIKSLEWRNKRLQKAQESNYICEHCGKVVPKGFHIHHKTYKNFKNEPMCDLEFLCEECHINTHCGIVARKNKSLKNKKSIKNCSCCYYSQKIKYKGKNGKTLKTVLWCNKYCKSCEYDNLCRNYKKGTVKKEIKPTKNKNNKNNSKNKILFKCKYCGCEKYIIKQHKVNTGIYCSKCKRWDKFLSKKELEKLDIK